MTATVALAIASLDGRERHGVLLSSLVPVACHPPRVAVKVEGKVTVAVTVTNMAPVALAREVMVTVE